MLSGLELALAAAALLAGLTGTWSPCGFSMIETIGPRGHRGGRPVTFAACATFTIGALAGGVVTFGSLASLGALAHGAGGELAYILAATLALAAAALEVRAVPILPQVRRQLPEHWRREMPMPVAAALYGILLGLGFTTFVLTFGVFALAGIVVAVGEPAAGLIVGLAFGVGRALPVALTAPVADRPLGIRITELMADRPAILAGFRAADAGALVVCAIALALAVSGGSGEDRARARGRSFHLRQERRVPASGSIGSPRARTAPGRSPGTRSGARRRADRGDRRRWDHDLERPRPDRARACARARRGRGCGFEAVVGMEGAGRQPRRAARPRADRRGAPRT